MWRNSAYCIGETECVRIQGHVQSHAFSLGFRIKLLPHAMAIGNIHKGTCMKQITLGVGIAWVHGQNLPDHYHAGKIEWANACNDAQRLLDSVAVNACGHVLK